MRGSESANLVGGLLLLLLAQRLVFQQLHEGQDLPADELAKQQRGHECRSAGFACSVTAGCFKDAVEIVDQPSVPKTQQDAFDQVERNAGFLGQCL